MILANSWESCLTNYRVASVDYQDARACPVWERKAVILLKPDDFPARRL